jgi:hypothetical protein
VDTETKTKRRRGRPSGQFARNAAKVMEILRFLETVSGSKPFPGNEYLAKRLGCSVRQVQRYLHFLVGKATKLIVLFAFFFMAGVGMVIAYSALLALVSVLLFGGNRAR